MTSTNGHRSRVCELNGNGRDTEALCRHLFSLAKAALESVACFVVVYIYLVRRYGWGGGRRLTSTKKPTEGKIATSSFVFVQLRLSFRAKNKLCLECRRKWNYQAEIVRVQLILYMSRESGSRRSNKGGRQSQQNYGRWKRLGFWDS